MRVSGLGFRAQESDFRVSSFGFQVLGFGSRISGFRFQVPGFTLRVSGCGFRVMGFGFWDVGFGFRVTATQLRPHPPRPYPRRPLREGSRTTPLSPRVHRAPCRRFRGQSSYTKVQSVMYDSGSVPRRAVFSPREVGERIRVEGLRLANDERRSRSRAHIFPFAASSSCLLPWDSGLKPGLRGWGEDA